MPEVEWREHNSSKSEMFATLHKMMVKVHKTSKDTDWHVVMWQCPHEHRFRFTAGLCGWWQRMRNAISR